MLRMRTNRSPSPKLKPLHQAEAPPPRRANKQEPLPRAATRLPPPLMEGSEWHC